jgi:hypothetical protein
MLPTEEFTIEAPPPTATHYITDSAGKTLMFYRVGTFTYHPKHSGETIDTLEYLSFCNLWQGSATNPGDQRKELLAKLIPLAGAQPYHRTWQNLYAKPSTPSR